jgi:hypothetical protein
MYPRGWRTQTAQALGLLIAVAVVGRLVWELLAPLLPVLVALAGLLAVYVLIFRRR